MDVGDTMVCTVTNTVVRPTLTLVKNVDGGPAGPGDWELAATGPTSISGRSGDEAVTSAAVDAGSYELSETPVDGTTAADGYTPGDWVCDAGTLSGSQLTLAPGENATCEITNSWTGGSLTLVKEVADGQVVPPGGAVPGDWTVRAEGPVTVEGPGGSAGLVERQVPAGSYDLSESVTEGSAVHPDYRPSDWVCTGNGFSWAGEEPGVGTLTIEPRENADVTCTVTNLFQPPHLTLRKVVEGGGPLGDVNDWNLAFEAVDDPGGSEGSGVTGAGPITGIAVGSGTYRLSEEASDPSWETGYETSAWQCTGGTVTPGPDGTAERTLTTDVRVRDSSSTPRSPGPECSTSNPARRSPAL